MSTADRGASDEYSRGQRPHEGPEGPPDSPPAGAFAVPRSRRHALARRLDGLSVSLARVPPRSGPVAAFTERVLAALGILGALLLILSEFLTLYTVDASGAARQHITVSGHHQHAFALAVIGLAVLALTLAGVRRMPAAILARLVLALAAVIIGPVGDGHDVTSTGVLATLYETATAHAGNGYRAELVGAVLLLLAGACQLLLTLPARGPTGRPGPRGRDAGRTGGSGGGDALARNPYAD